jgi:hypothetical protein
MNRCIEGKFGEAYFVSRDLVAGASAPATTAASAREPARWFCGSAVRRAIGGTKDGKLYRVSLPCAFRAGNLLLFIEDNLLEVRLAIFTNVFVNGHLQTSI